MFFLKLFQLENQNAIILIIILLLIFNNNNNNITFS